MMKAPKYSKQKSDFTIELRRSVKEYFVQNNIPQTGNPGIILKTIFMMLVYLVPFSLMIAGMITSVPVMLACWILMGMGMSGVGMVTMHDANHGSFSRDKKVNRLFGNSLYLLGGFPPNWRHQHNTLHHGYPNIDGQDEDIAPGIILRFSPHQSYKWFHRYQYLYAWFFYSLMTLSWVITKDFGRLRKYNKEGVKLNGKKSYQRLFVELLISKILYYTIILVIPLLTVPVSWTWIVAGFILMHLTGGLILTTIFQTAHVVPSSAYPLPDEKGDMDSNWAVHQLYTTCDFAPRSNVFSWLIGGLNYQIEHHLFPNISHIHYKNIAQIVHQTAEKYGLPYHVNKTFTGAVYQHVKMLKVLGTTPDITVPSVLNYHTAPRLVEEKPIKRQVAE